jgi:hypothetical protein
VRTPYPGYDVLAKWDTPSFNNRTREVLAERLSRVPPRRFLSRDDWDLLEAIVARLVPQPDRSQPVPIVPGIDEALLLNRGEGYRGDGHPPMRETWRIGLAGVRAESLSRFAAPFSALDPARQDALLRAVQAGDVDREAWAGIEPRHFFVHVLLKTVAGLYYTHPAAWSEIGFGGPASPRGYVRLGFDERDPWEARASHDD